MTLRTDAVSKIYIGDTNNYLALNEGELTFYSAAQPAGKSLDDLLASDPPDLTGYLKADGSVAMTGALKTAKIANDAGLTIRNAADSANASLTAASVSADDFIEAPYVYTGGQGSYIGSVGTSVDLGFYDGEAAPVKLLAAGMYPAATGAATLTLGVAGQSQKVHVPYRVGIGDTASAPAAQLDLSSDTGGTAALRITRTSSGSVLEYLAAHTPVGNEVVWRVTGDVIAARTKTANGTGYRAGDWQFDKDVSILGELSIKVVAQATEPTISADNRMVIWKDTDDSDKIYLVFRRGSGDQVKLLFS